MRLDQGGPDRAQVVGEPDADARLLARFRLAVPGDCTDGDSAGPAMRSVPALAEASVCAAASPPVLCSVDSSAGFGMSSGLTRPWMTWSEPSRPTVAMQPAMAKSSGLNLARDAAFASISSRRASTASASATSSSVQSSSSRLISSSWRARSFSISAFSAPVGSAGSGWMRP